MQAGEKLICDDGEILYVISEEKSGNYKFLNLFCPVCYHELKHVLKGNIKKRGCYVCHSIKLKINELKSVSEKISSFNNTTIKVVGKQYNYFLFKCTKCGLTFRQKWSMKRNVHCIYCSDYAKPNVFQAYQLLNKNGSNLKFCDLKSYVSMNVPIKIRCNTCGNIKVQSPRYASTGGCKICAGSAKKTLEQRQNEVALASHGHVKLLSLWDTGINYKVVGSFVCDKGHTFERDINTFLTSQSMCSICFSSNGENKIYNYLSDNGINFERQKRFPTCIYKNMLPFDFYIDEKVLVEFDGIQHFEHNTLFDKTDPLSGRQTRDKIKNNWAK